MNRLLFSILSLTLSSATVLYAQGQATAQSPDGRLQVSVKTPASAPALYSVTYDGQPILLDSPLGLVANYGDFSTSLKLVSTDVDTVTQAYDISRTKTSHVDSKATRLVCHVQNAKGHKMTVEFRIDNNNIGMRYALARAGETGSVRVMNEATSFRFPAGTTTFLTPQSDPMIGWKRTKPSYEEVYVYDAPMSQTSQYGKGWTFPCLFKVGGEQPCWVLVSETNVDSRYCGSRLSDAVMGADGSGTYQLTFPMAEENNGNGTVEPAFSLPGATPWRTLTVGKTLAPIAETTIMNDLVTPRYEPSKTYDFGKGTWSWIVWQDNSINYQDIKTYIDFSAAMGYKFALVDNYWDEEKRIGRRRLPELVDYARQKGVRLIMWYSSSGYWNDIVQGPTNCMDNSINRKREMQWLKSLGIAGIKVDFFGGDKQETMRLYEEILSDANDNGLFVIFHGCTIPRGWERMYPNYVGSEAVLASENIYFDQGACDREARDITTHPFIRNAQGCMEFGGCFMNRRISRDNASRNYRRTSDAAELATCVLFQNPIQNFALAPNNLEDAPKCCLDFLRQVPTEWDETRLIDGYPGKYVVLARRHGTQWYVAAVNAQDEPLKLSLDLSVLPGFDASQAQIITGGCTEPNSKTPQPSQRPLKLRKGRLNLTVPTADGFVIF